MKQRARIYYSVSQRALIWERWQKGETLHQIARLFDRYHASIRGVVAETGGIRPAERRRSRLALTLTEREEISRAMVAGQSRRSIAGSLGRAASTISRELRRHGGSGSYRASGADQAAWDRARRPKGCKLVQKPALARIVASKLRRNWSPQQTAGWLKRTYPDDETYQVSHETIYRSLFIQARGALKCCSTCGAPGGHAVRATTPKRPLFTVASPTRYRSVSGLPPLRPGRYLGTGKVTSCSAATTARLRHWSNGNPAT